MNNANEVRIADLGVSELLAIPDLSHSARLVELIHSHGPEMRRLLGNASMDAPPTPEASPKGSAKSISVQEKRVFHREATTLVYRAPEQLLKAARGYDERADLWSLGCVLFELVVGRPLFGSTHDENHLVALQMKVLGEAVYRSVPDLWAIAEASHTHPAWSFNNLGEYLAKCKIDPVTADLLVKLLQLDPKKRLPAKDVLLHPFFQNRQPPGPREFSY